TWRNGVKPVAPRARATRSARNRSPLLFVDTMAALGLLVTGTRLAAAKTIRRQQTPTAALLGVAEELPAWGAGPGRAGGARRRPSHPPTSEAGRRPARGRPARARRFVRASTHTEGCKRVAFRARIVKTNATHPAAFWSNSGQGQAASGISLAKQGWRQSIGL